MCNFFFSTSSMIRNAKTFSDIIICDTTFGMNRFSMPLMLIIGVNHEFANVILAFALTRSEEAKNFMWVFQRYKEVVHKADPRIVVTDACPSFNKAVQEEFPSSQHVLCRWHLMQNLKKQFAYLNTKKGT